MHVNVLEVLNYLRMYLRSVNEIHCIYAFISAVCPARRNSGALLFVRTRIRYSNLLENKGDTKRGRKR